MKVTHLRVIQRGCKGLCPNCGRPTTYCLVLLDNLPANREGRAGDDP